VEIISLPPEGMFRGDLLVIHLASTDNLTSNNEETEHIQTQTKVNAKSGPNGHTQKTYVNRKDKQSLV